MTVLDIIFLAIIIVFVFAVLNAVWSLLEGGQ